MFARDHTHRLWRSGVANAAEEAVAEELSPSQELFTTVVLEQDDDTAVTSCFRVHSSCQSCYGRICQSDKSDKSEEFKSLSDEFNCQWDKFIYQLDEFTVYLPTGRIQLPKGRIQLPKPVKKNLYALKQTWLVH